MNDRVMIDRAVNNRGMDEPSHVLCRRRLLGWLAASSLAPGAMAEGAVAEDAQSNASEAINVFDVERVARGELSEEVTRWIADGADDGRTVAENRRAFEDVSIRARRLVDVSRIDTRVTLLGQSLVHPILLAPVGNLDLIVPGGDSAVARAATATRSVMMAATLSNETIEHIAQSAREPPWFQLYPLADRGVMRDLLARAEAAGCTTLVVTVDSPALGNRESARRGVRPATRARVANLERYTPRPVVGDASLDWSFVSWLRDNTRMRIVLKGIVTREDANLTIASGADGLVVSNHGGRQEESLRSTLASLPEIVEAVDDRVAVIIDGGFRRGTDVFKALALGADAVSIGRPYLWGLGAFGEAGVVRVVEILRAELVKIMQLAGCPDVSAIHRSFVENRSST